MRRLLRWAFNFAAVVSALLFVATCVLWVRSYWIADALSRFNAPTFREHWMFLSRGRVWFGTMGSKGEIFVGVPVDMGVVLSHQVPSNMGCDYNWFGFGWEPPYGRDDPRGVVIPYWFILIGAATLPMYRVGRLARRRQRFAGLCPRCGYDLRATPDRCPECGAVPTGKAAT